MQFIHSEKLIEEYKNNFTGLVLVKGYYSSPELIIEINKMINKLQLPETLDISKSIVSKWKEIFIRMGADSSFSSSLESLLGYYKSKNKLYIINEIVDFYNYYSLCNGMPMAAYDCDKIEGDIKLEAPGKGLPFTPLGKPKKVEETVESEIAYVDNNKVLCRYWNLRDCDQTKITNDTVNILFIFDIFAENSNSAKQKFSETEKDFSEIFKSAMVFSGLTGPTIGNELDF